MARFALVFAGLLLASCVEEPSTGPQGKALTSTERAECLMKGGKVGRGGLLPDEVCFLPEPDAGKSCTKKTDCEGLCLADTRTCSPVTPMFGCFEFLDDTGQKVGICID
ncbi:hypothetical protein [Tabrizicola sp.]|jgi:hypothetical protein|uniref:hypothetical protein n=1 Tax=Tabrizicola sp. TaxID=2005166 RepID=UPI001A4A7BC7|nr:hypothetical protein [Tabrizicola sp.]MBL9072249.1 hypothetical protein [Tabrizicola sp.]